MSEHVEVSRDGAVQIVRLNRPEKKNALSGAMYGVLTRALKDASDENGIAATVFLGQPGIFCAGNDVADFLAASEGNFSLRALDFLYAVADCATPLVAAVDGPAVGIGTTLTMHCDLVFASPRATFQTPFVSLGLVPEAASSLIAPRLMGRARAFELLVMGEAFSAERAQAAGFVNHVIDSGKVEAAALDAARAIAKKPREAVRLSRLLLKGDPDEIKRRMKEEVGLFADRLKSPEARAAFQGFLQKTTGTASA